MALAITATAPLSAAGEGGATQEDLAAIRSRIRNEAGVTREWLAQSGSGVVWRFEESDVNGEGEDIPMVPFTVLPGDTHKKLALDLTGSEEATSILRAVIQNPTPGAEFLFPRALLTPEFSDERLTAVSLDKSAPNLASLVADKLAAPRIEAPRTTRNLMRLNGFLDTSKVGKGASVLVPQALLKTAPKKTDLKISDQYLLAPAKKIVRKGGKSGSKKSKVVRVSHPTHRRTQAIDLVVLHTTEHSGGSLDTVAHYIRRNGLANYLIGPKGEVYRIVPEEEVANGCGESLWEGRFEVNQRALNIEIYADTAPGPKYSGIAPEQYEGLKKLLDDIASRRPQIHKGRVVTHSMVAMSFKYGTRSRKGDPHEFSWEDAGLPNNALMLDQDVLLGRVSLTRDKRFADRITPGQTAAANYLNRM